MTVGDHVTVRVSDHLMPSCLPPQLFRPAGLLLTAAIGAAPGTIDAAYDVERMYEYLDYVHGELMTTS